MDFAFGIRADKQLAGLAGPIPFFRFNPLQQGENGHHALQGPHTNVLALGDHNLAAVQNEAVPHQDRLITITVDSFRGDFQFIHALILSLSKQRKFVYSIFWVSPLEIVSRQMLDFKEMIQRVNSQIDLTLCIYTPYHSGFKTICYLVLEIWNFIALFNLL